MMMISIRKITFREQELNWLFAKYKRLENNPLCGIPDSGETAMAFNVLVSKTRHYSTKLCFAT